jgi:hypothetical protein
VGGAEGVEGDAGEELGSPSRISERLDEGELDFLRDFLEETKEDPPIKEAAGDTSRIDINEEITLGLAIPSPEAASLDFEEGVDTAINTTVEEEAPSPTGSGNSWGSAFDEQVDTDEDGSATVDGEQEVDGISGEDLEKMGWSRSDWNALNEDDSSAVPKGQELVDITDEELEQMGWSRSDWNALNPLNESSDDDDEFEPDAEEEQQEQQDEQIDEQQLSEDEESSVDGSVQDEGSSTVTSHQASTAEQVDIAVGSSTPATSIDEETSSLYLQLEEANLEWSQRRLGDFPSVSEDGKYLDLAGYHQVSVEEFAMTTNFVKYTPLSEQGEWNARNARSTILDMAENSLMTGVLNTVYEANLKANEFVPPSDSRPNRMQAVVPPFSKDCPGDIIVGTVGNKKTYITDVEPDLTIRLSSEEFRSMERVEALFRTVPSSFEDDIPLSKKTLWLMANALIQSIQQPTISSYALYVYRMFVSLEEDGIPPELRFPAPPKALLGFLAKMIDKYGSDYARKHLNGVDFFYQLHHLSTGIDPERKARMLRGAKIIHPSRRKKDREVVIEDLEVFIQDQIEAAEKNALLLSRTICLIAASLLLFWGMCRSGEIVLPRYKDKVSKASKKDDEPPASKKSKSTFSRDDIIAAYDPKYDISVSNVVFKHPAPGSGQPRIAIAHLPFTKAEREEGRDVVVPEQTNFGDNLNPLPWLQRQVEQFAKEKEDGYLFRYRETESRKWRILTRTFFLSMWNASMSKHEHEPIKGHAFRKGVSLHCSPSPLFFTQSNSFFPSLQFLPFPSLYLITPLLYSNRVPTSSSSAESIPK